ncbi:MAG: CapA family protein [Phascolarctobacterium sp.]|nr:CapA family protein [Phascolarctobacterium sp.]
MKTFKSRLLKKLFTAAGITLLLGSFSLTALAEDVHIKVEEGKFAKTKTKLTQEQKADKIKADLGVQPNKKVKVVKKSKDSKNTGKDVSAQSGQTDKPIEQPTTPETPVAPPPPVPQSIVVSVAGDCTMGSYLEEGQVFDPEYREPGSYESYYSAYGPTYFFKNVKEVFEKDDFTWINLEGPLTNNAPVEIKTFPIRCHPEELNTLKASSVEVCHVANNHIYDCGWDGFNDTVNILNANNIGISGEGHKYTTTKNGIKISFLGYTSFAANSELYDMIKKDIEDVRKAGSNVVMVQFHGGEERIYYPPADQRDVFRYTIDSGADVVIGAHPHVMQGIEMYHGKPICYSMGNFSFGANWNPVDKDTFIYQATFSWTKDKGVALTGQKVIPCRISSVTYRNDFCPTILTGAEGESVLARLQAYSSIFEVPYDFSADFKDLYAANAQTTANNLQ